MENLWVSLAIKVERCQCRWTWEPFLGQGLPQDQPSTGNNILLPFSVPKLSGRMGINFYSLNSADRSHLKRKLELDLESEYHPWWCLIINILICGDLEKRSSYIFQTFNKNSSMQYIVLGSRKNLILFQSSLYSGEELHQIYSSLRLSCAPKSQSFLYAHVSNSIWSNFYQESLQIGLFFHGYSWFFRFSPFCFNPSPS